MHLLQYSWLIGSCLFFQGSTAFAEGMHSDSIPSQAALLPEIIVQRNSSLARINGDSISFDARRWKDAGVVKLEDLLKKIPGFQVDAQGRILFNGKTISRILLDGEDLTGLRYTMLSRNLRAMLVDTVQVVGSYHDNRLMKGFVDANQLALNIKIDKAYHGRLSGSASLSRAQTTHGKTDLDLTRLLTAGKHLVFVNTNNTGDPGVLDQQMVSGITTGDAGDQRFSSWPFVFDEGELFSALPQWYTTMNQDKTGLYVGVLPAGRHSKLRINAHGLRSSDLRISSRSMELLFRDQLPLNIQSRVSRQQHQKEAGIMLQLERDNGKKRISGFKVVFSKLVAETDRREERSSTRYTQAAIHDSMHTFVFQADHQETWLLQRKGLLVLKNSIAIDQNKNNVFLKGYPQGFLLSYFQEDVHPLFMVHQGLRASSDLVLMNRAAKWNWHLGWRNQVDHIHSRVRQQKLGMLLFRSYPYATLVHQRTKKLGVETHAAGGASVVVTRPGQSVGHPVFHLEQALCWRPRVMQEFRVAYLISQKTPDLDFFHAGPVFSVDGGMRFGTDSLVFPLQQSIQVDLRKTDLYRGFSVSLTARLSLLNNELAPASFIDPVVEGSRYFLRPQHKAVFLVGSAEKFIHPFNVRYTFNLRFNGFRAIQQVNGRNASTLLKTMLLDHRLITKWKGAFQWEGYQIVAVHHVVSKGFSSPASAIRQQYGLIQQVHLSSFFQGSLNAALIRFGDGAFFPVLDIAVRSSISSRWSASIHMRNLFNQHHYREQSAGVLGTAVQEIQLNGRTIICGLQWNF